VRGIALALALGLAASAAGAAAAPKPAFRVTIQATMDVQAAIARGTGCTENVTRHVEIRNAKPLTLTADQLGKTKNGLFELVATETRSDAYSSGCADQLPTSTCGTVTYKIGSIGTAVGFLNRKTAKFVLFYTRISTDPYQGQCGARLAGVGPEPGAAPGTTVTAWNDAFPPTGLNPAGPSGSPPVPDPLVDRAKLLAGKPFTVRWSSSGPYQHPYDPVQEQLASTWQVTLVPV
jgi:hypothetical protein